MLIASTFSVMLGNGSLHCACHRYYFRYRPNSHYDEMVADLVTDYTELIDRLKELAKSHFENKDESDIIFQNEFENLLKTTEANRFAE
jgi:hypothetical protein